MTPLSVAVPGRARLRVPGLRKHRDLAEFLEERLRAHPQVRSARANPITGNVLIVFDDHHLSLRDIIRDLGKLSRRRYLDLLPSTERVPSWAEQRPYYAMEPASVVSHLASSSQSGLSPQEAVARLAVIGPNRMATRHGRRLWKVIATHILSVPALLLAAAAGLSLATGGLLEGGVILLVVALNTMIGTLMEGWAERTIASLGALVTPHAIARRAGRDRTIDAAELVPGDLLVLTPGCRVSADARILTADQLVVIESTLTGESLPVEKWPDRILAATAPIVDRANMVYAGTVVAHGQGVALVTATGRRTELGKIRALLEEPAHRQLALARDLERMSGRLVALSLGLSGIALGLGLLRGVGFLEMLRTAIALAVATVPEGLPTVTTAACALGMRRLRRGGVLIRELDTVERLGAVSVICVDKTGTITDGRMRVQEWSLGLNKRLPTCTHGDPLVRRALEIAALCNESELDPAPIGSPTELALLGAAQEAGLDYRAIRARYPRLWLDPRREHHNWMATGHQLGEGLHLVAVKGAPEEVLELSAFLDDGYALEPLTSSARLDIERINARMAAAGMRVLGLAWKTEEPNLVPSEGLAWIGLVGLADPIREGVREALTLCRRAGIRVIMLTGDQLLTAAAVAREAELCAAAPSRVLDASRPGIDGRRLGDLVRSVNVFARVSPAQKHHIVRRLQQAGEIVAMVGDGINDAPALRAADIGIAIGSGGTAVARDVADVVLADEDFGSLLGAIAQGRATHANTKKAVRFLLSTNLSEILVTLTALAGGVGRPLSPIQFLWMNLLSDVLPALALASEPPEPAIMDSGPLSCDTSVLSTPALRRIAADGVVLSAGTLGSYLASLARHGTGSRSSSVAFATLTGAQLLHAATCRSDSRPSWRALAENPAMLAAIATTLGLGTAAVSLGPLRGILGTSSLDRTDWTTVIAGALLPTLTAPLRERMAPRGPSHSYR